MRSVSIGVGNSICTAITVFLAVVSTKAAVIDLDSVAPGKAAFEVNGQGFTYDVAEKGQCTSQSYCFVNLTPIKG